MQDLELSHKLKTMWGIDEKINRGAQLEEHELKFYNSNLKVIKEYYHKNLEYWESRQRLQGIAFPQGAI